MFHEYPKQTVGGDVFVPCMLCTQSVQHGFDLREQNAKFPVLRALIHVHAVSQMVDLDMAVVVFCVPTAR